MKLDNTNSDMTCFTFLVFLVMTLYFKMIRNHIRPYYIEGKKQYVTKEVSKFTVLIKNWAKRTWMTCYFH